jgi:hypothetical protein
MPGFCVNCGAPITGPFCNQCGARAVAPSAPAPPIVPPQPIAPAPIPPPAPIPVQVAPPAPAAKSSGMGKVLLWVGMILLVLFLGGVGATLYGYYWVKHKVTSYTSAITGGLTEPMKVVEHGDSCRLLSTADLQQVLGVPIEKSAEIVEGSDPGCAYYTNQAAFAKLRRMALEQARKQAAEAAKRPGPQVDNPLALLKDTNQMEGFVKTLSGQDPAKDGQVFSFTIQRGFGSSSWSGMRVVEAALPGFEDVNGVGDQAMVGTFGHAFYTLKGDTMIRLDTTLVPDARTRGAQIGKKILSGL